MLSEMFKFSWLQLFLCFLLLLNPLLCIGKESVERNQGIAKELKIPVIALSQVNRGVESRTSTSKRPILADLRESGAIEQDADIVTFIYRPEYYKIYEWENSDDSRGQAEIIIAKHRNGSLENVRLKFISHLAKFSDLDYFDGVQENDSFGDEPSFISHSSSMNDED